MTTPQTPWNVSARASLILRLVAIAAVFAMFIAGFLCLDHVTADRVATGLIAGAVALACMIIV